MPQPAATSRPSSPRRRDEPSRCRRRVSGPEPKHRSLRACLSRVEDGVDAGSKPELTYIDVDGAARDVADDDVECRGRVERNRQAHRTARPAQQQRLSPPSRHNRPIASRAASLTTRRPPRASTRSDELSERCTVIACQNPT